MKVVHPELDALGANGTSASAAGIFERAAAAYPDRIALICRLGAISYRELDAAAERLAARIQADGAPGDRVALIMPQDRRSIIALLAVLKAGRIVVFVNMADPPARLSLLIADAEPTIIVSDAEHLSLAKSLAGPGVAAFTVDDVADGPAAKPLPLPGPYDPAFFVYTSGSTGRPKAVMQTHGHTLRDALDTSEALAVTADDRILLVASLWGAQALTTTWLAFANGATLVSWPAVENGMTGLADWLIRHRVTMFVGASSLFRYFIKGLESASFPGIRMVKLSADAATREDFLSFRRHFPNGTLVNAMGCSECGHLTYMTLPRDAQVEEGRLPIGRPFPRVDLRLVDEAGVALPRGSTGTIEIHLKYLAAGYWRDEQATAKSFGRDAEGNQIFRGADQARFDEDGNLVFAGRSDATFKIRGQRVDLAEAERAVAGIPDVAAAVVIAAPRWNDELQLVAFVQPQASSGLTLRKMRRLARGLLPRHLVPSAFIFMDEMPRTANGKVDRGALRERSAASRQAKPEPAQSQTEALLVELWEHAFELAGVGRTDDFFELGGDSLVAAVISARLSDKLGVAIDFGTFSDNPVLAEMARAVDEAPRPAAGDEPPLVPVGRARPLPVTSLQDPFWSDSRNPRHSRRHTRAAGGWIDGPLDIDVLQQALNEVVARHESLRTRFQEIDGQACQVIDPPGPVALPLVDLTSHADAKTRVAEIIAEERVRYFDLTSAPPIAFQLIRLKHEQHVLVQASHHISTDAQSWVVFVNDLARSYERRIDGVEPAPPPASIQFADYAVWARQLWAPESPKSLKAVDWWAQSLKHSATPPALALSVEPLRRRAKASQGAGSEVVWGFDGAISERLEKLGRGVGASYFSVRFACVVPVLSALTGYRSLPLPVVFTDRTRPVLEGLFGAMANALPVIVDYDPDQSFRSLIGAVQRRLIEQLANGNIPQPRLLAELRKRGIGLPWSYNAVHLTTPVPPAHFAGLTLTWRDAEPYPPVRGLTFLFNELNEQRGCRIAFNADMYDESSISELAGYIVAFVTAAVGEPDAPVGSLVAAAGVPSVKPTARAIVDENHRRGGVELGSGA